MTNYKLGDIKYYWKIHCARMKSLGENPVSYTCFARRLRMGMILHDAIYTPRVEYQVRDKSPKYPLQDAIRRKRKLKEENIQILTFDEIEKVERRSLKANRHNMKPKKSLWSRFISLFK